MLLLIGPHAIDFSVHVFDEVLYDFDPLDDFILKNAHPILLIFICPTVSSEKVALGVGQNAVDNQVFINRVVEPGTDLVPRVVTVDPIRSTAKSPHQVMGLHVLTRTDSIRAIIILNGGSPVCGCSTIYFRKIDQLLLMGDSYRLYGVHNACLAGGTV